jgi:hypothetical protein
LKKPPLGAVFSFTASTASVVVSAVFQSLFQFSPGAIQATLAAWPGAVVTG